MNFRLIQEELSSLPLGPLRYFDSIGSTNEEAMRWAEAGAPHLALVTADEQTAGRGRMGRRWFTPPGAALAFSLVLRLAEIRTSAQYGSSEKSGIEEDLSSKWAIQRLSGLAALAVCSALEAEYDLRPLIKWPNDVLLGGCKTCGVLPELSWLGDVPQTAILGIGINIAPESVPAPAGLLFPATCLEDELGRKIDRWAVLREVLSALLSWMPRLNSPDFIQAWESHLAFLGDLVRLEGAGSLVGEGRLTGLKPDGSLRLQSFSGEELVFQAGELSLRPGSE